jgi:hypothetical protein
MTLHPGVVAQFMDPIENQQTETGPPLVGFMVNTSETLIEGAAFGFDITRGRTYNTRCSVNWEATTGDPADLEGTTSGVATFENGETAKSIVVKTVRRTGIQEVRVATVRLYAPSGCEIDEVTGTNRTFAILDSEGQVDPSDPGLPLATRVIYVNNAVELALAEGSNWSSLVTDPPGATGPLAPGDRVVLKNGTYAGDKIVGPISGATSLSPIVYMAENTNEAKVDGNWTLTGAARWIYGLYFNDAKNVFVKGAADDARISHCRTKAGKDTAGIWVDAGPKRVRVDYNDVDNGLGGGMGVRITPTAGCAHIVEYNYIHDNPDTQAGARGVSIGTSNAHNLLSARCTVQYNRFERWEGVDVKPIEAKSCDNNITFNYGVNCDGKWFNRGGRRNKWWANWIEGATDLVIADGDNDVRWNIVQYEQPLPEDPNYGIRIMAGDTVSVEGGTVGTYMAAANTKVIGNTAALFVGNNPLPAYTVPASNTVIEVHNGTVELQLQTGTTTKPTTASPLMVPRRIALEEVGPFAPRTVAPGDQTDLPYAGQRFGMCVPTPGQTAVRFAEAIAIRFEAEYSGAIDSIKFWARVNQGSELNFSTGNGGEVSVDIVANNPSGDVPTSTLLGSTGKIGPVVGASEFPSLAFINKPVLTRGVIYHAVFKQSKSADGTFSLGMADHAPMSVPRFPFDLNWAVLLFNNGVWSQGINQTPNLLPVFEVAYSDGVVKGQGYLGGDRIATAVTIGGDAIARQRFMMPLHQIKKTQRVQLWVSRLATGTGNLTVSLYDELLALKAQAEIPRSAVAISPLTNRADPNVSWVDEQWDETQLDKGKTYFVELSAPAGANYRILPCINGGFAAGFKEDKLLWGESPGQSSSMRAEYHPAGGTWDLWPGTSLANGVDLPILLHTTYVVDDTTPEVPVDPLPDQPDQVAGGRYWPHSGPMFMAGAGIYRIRYGSPLKFITSVPRTGTLSDLATWWVWDASQILTSAALSGGDPPWNLKVEVFLWSGTGTLGAGANTRILLLNPWVVTNRNMISDNGLGGALKMALISAVSVNLDQQLAWQITNLDATDTGAVGSDTSKYISVRMVSQSKLSTQLIYYPFGKTPPTHAGPAWGDLRYPGLVVPNAGYDLANIPVQLAWYSDSDSRPWGLSYPMANASNNRTVRVSNAFRTKWTPTEDVTLGAIWFFASYAVTKPSAPLVIEIRKESDASLVASFTFDFNPLTDVGWDVTAGVGSPVLYHQNKDGGGNFSLVGGTVYHVIIKGPTTGGGWRVGYQQVDDYSIQSAANKLAYPWNYNPSGVQPMHGLWPGAITEISTDNGVTYPAPNLADNADVIRRRIAGGTGPNGICLYATPPILFDKADPVVIPPPDPVDDVNVYNQDLPFGGQYDGMSVMLGSAGNVNYWKSNPNVAGDAQVAWSASREATYMVFPLEYVKPGVKIKYVQWNNRDDNVGSHNGYSQGFGGEIELSFYKCASGYQEELVLGAFLGKTRSVLNPADRSNNDANWRTEWQQQGGGASDTIPQYFQQYPTMQILTPFDPAANGMKVGDLLVIKFLNKDHVLWTSVNNAYSSCYNTSAVGRSPFPLHAKIMMHRLLSGGVDNAHFPLCMIGYDNGVVTGNNHQGSSSTTQITGSDYIYISAANGNKIRMIIPCTRDNTYLKRFFTWALREKDTSTTGALRVKIYETATNPVPDNTSDVGTLKHTFDIPMSQIPYVSSAKMGAATMWQTVSLGTQVPLVKGKNYYVEISSTGAQVTYFVMPRTLARAGRGLLNSRNLRTKSQWWNQSASKWVTFYDSGTTNGAPNPARFGALVDIPVLVSYI